jgi:uncharacterized protein (TIGR02996 family)
MTLTSDSSKVADERGLEMEAAFEAALHAEGDDPALRLVYADWLEEQGRLAEAAKFRSDARRCEDRATQDRLVAPARRLRASRELPGKEAEDLAFVATMIQLLITCGFAVLAR